MASQKESLDPVCSLSEAAIRLHLSAPTVRILIERGVLLTTGGQNSVKIEAESLARAKDTLTVMRRQHREPDWLATFIRLNPSSASN